MIKFLRQVTVLLFAQSAFVEAVTTIGDYCLVQGLYVPQGEVWQPAGKCAETTCVGKNVTFTKGCSAPVVTEGWVLTPEDPSMAYPDCCPKYVSPDSPIASKPTLKPEIINSSDGADDSGTEVDSFEPFDCCFHCCFHCCMELMHNRERHGFNSSEESTESEESEEY